MNPFIPLVLSVAPIFIVLMVLRLWRWRRNLRHLRTPLTHALLRSPGESLRLKIEDLSWDMAMWTSMTTTIPIILYASYHVHAQLTEIPPSLFWSLAISGGGIGFAIYKLIKTVRTRSRMRQGLDGELAVGQELTELLKKGMSVFHDFPAPGYNIDHIVVGPKGVFAVETKTRAKSKVGNGQSGVEVRVDGDTLVFPNWRQPRWIEQARRQATSLSEWVTRKTGESIRVKPVLALPGWYVLPNSGDVLVFNPKMIHELNDQPLTNEQVAKVAKAIEDHCRNVGPSEI